MRFEGQPARFESVRRGSHQLRKNKEARKSRLRLVGGRETGSESSTKDRNLLFATISSDPAKPPFSVKRSHGKTCRGRADLKAGYLDVDKSPWRTGQKKRPFESDLWARSFPPQLSSLFRHPSSFPPFLSFLFTLSALPLQSKMASALARATLRLGMIPADGIGSSPRSTSASPSSSFPLSLPSSGLPSQPLSLPSGL